LKGGYNDKWERDDCREESEWVVDSIYGEYGVEEGRPLLSATILGRVRETGNEIPAK
jgi:hypothetical protein